MRLLLFSERFDDPSSANALCIRNLVDALDRQGVETDVVCVDSADKSVPYEAQHVSVYAVARVKTWLEQRFPHCRPLRRAAALIGRVADAFFLCRSTLHEMYRQGETLLRNRRYDAVIAVYQSEMAVRCVLHLKKQLLGATSVLYMLDPIACVLHRRRAQTGNPGKAFDYLSALMLKRRAYRRFDLLLAMSTNRGSEPNWENRYAPKLRYLHLPLLTCCQPLQRVRNEEDKTCRLICYGILDSAFRSPAFLLETVQKLNQTMRVEVDFYTKGDCESMLQQYAGEHPRIIRQHGYVSRELLMQRIAEADAIVCICNRESTMLPSKVFDVLMLGVPTISLSSQEKDPADALFRRCDHVQIIKTADGVDAAAEKMRTFLEKQDTLCVENVRESLWEYTPEHNAAELIRLVNERSQRA